MIPINYFWIGDQLSPMELLTIRSCYQHQHQPVVWSYNNILNLPQFAVLKDASTVMDYEKFEYLKNHLKLPLPVISDVFRYKLLNKVGGIYSDTDVVLIKNVDRLANQTDFFCSSFEYYWGILANNCFMKVSAGSALAQYLCDESEKRLVEVEKNGLSDYCYIGPFLVQHTAKELNVSLLPFDFINPISWRWVPKLIAFKQPDRKFLLKNLVRRYIPFFEGRGYLVTSNTYAIHLCNEIWKQGDLKKDEIYHPSSLYERLKRKIKLTLPVTG